MSWKYLKLPLFTDCGIPYGVRRSADLRAARALLSSNARYLDEARTGTAPLVAQTGGNLRA